MNHLGDYYSQSTEEMFIIRYLYAGNRTTGRFLDIGAYDGKAFSNTYRLALLGWSGICIEPSPQVYPQLAKLYANNDKVRTVNCAVGDYDGELDFYDEAGAVGTARLEHYLTWKNQAGVKYSQIKVPVVSWGTFYETFPGTYEFVSIDTEGMDYRILKQMIPDLPEMATELICVEYTYEGNEIYNMLLDAGYLLYHQNGENIIMRKK